MDDNLDKILQSWDTPPEVVDNFRKNGLNVEQFKYLVSNETILKELCPHIGHRIKLCCQMQAYLDSLTETETVSSLSADLTIIKANCPELMQLDQEGSMLLADPSDLDVYLNIPSRRSLPEFDLKTILQTSPQGNSVLNFYKKYKHLNSQKRNIIVDILVKYHYTFIINNNIKPEEFNLLAAKIVALFPTESIYTYYMKAVPTSKSATRKYVPAKGKLTDKVRNLLHLSGIKRRSTITADTTDPDSDTDTVRKVQDTVSNEDVIWLKHNNEPWERVVEKWNNTFDIRTNENFKTVHEFMETWSILKDSKADTLILLDFEKRYKEKALNFYKNWETFFSKVLEKRGSIVSNEDAKILIESLGDIADDDKKIPVQIYLLAYLVPPKGRKSRKIKFSTSESIQGLLIQTNEAGDIDDVIRKQKQKAAARSDTVQPYVLIQGPLQNFSQIYIIIDDVKYHMKSAAKAFDLLFKIFHVFHAKYPQVAEHLHLIIQKKVFEIHTAFDVVPPYIIDVLNL